MIILKIVFNKNKLKEEHERSHLTSNRLSYEPAESASNDSSYESEDLRQSYWSPSYASSHRSSR